MASKQAPQPVLRSPAPVMGERAERTSELILRTARQLFLARGYGGTRVENITEACGISRAGFYTYFPSKRDAFLALGAQAYTDVDAAISAFEAIPSDWKMDHLVQWALCYLEVLDEHGAFVHAWAQAAATDDELRRFGRRSELNQSRRVGETVARLGGRSAGDELATGLAVLAVLDRLWYFVELMGAPLEREATAKTAAKAIAGLIREEAA